MNHTVEQILSRYTTFLSYELKLFWIVFGVYSLAIALYVLHFIDHFSTLFEKVRDFSFIYGKLANFLLWLGVSLHSAWIVLRIVETQRAPVQNKYESLAIFAWTSILTYLLVHRRWKNIHLPGLIVTTVAVFGLYTAMSTSSLHPRVYKSVPALQSHWFELHAIIPFISYAVIVVSCAIEITYLLARFFRFVGRPALWLAKSKDYGAYNQSILDHDKFHKDAHTIVLFGFPILTFTIVSGAAWAQEAWTNYWGWDPLEIASLFTWAIFAFYLHCMTLAKWRGLPASFANCLGFVAMMITFIFRGYLFGVFGLPTMHGY